MKTNSHLFTHLAKSAYGRKLPGRKVREKPNTYFMPYYTSFPLFLRVLKIMESKAA
jgi:hypothetical protein